MPIDLPRLGMGTAAIGNLYRPVSDEEARGALEAAWNGGIRFFDTAPYYGFGLAETRLGAALCSLDPSGTAIVSTKVGRLLEPAPHAGRVRHGFVEGLNFEPVFDYSRDAVLRSHEQSLRRLGRRRADLLLAHDLGALTHGRDAGRHMRAFLDGGYSAMLDLKAQGAVDAIGIGVNEVEVCALLLERVDLDVILLAGRYTLLDRSAGTVLDRCREKGTRVIAGGPYNSGILALPTSRQAHPHYDYEPPSADILDRARRIEARCGALGVPMPAAALQFPLRHPAIASVIAGMANRGEVEQNLERFDTAIPDALWALLDADFPASPRGAEVGSAAQPPRLILLDEKDTVLVCVAPIEAGETVEIDGAAIRTGEPISVGHKVARRDLRPGEQVVKYGAPIGSITEGARAGSWVHVHNMKSDYIASHARETDGRAMQ